MALGNMEYLGEVDVDGLNPDAIPQPVTSWDGSPIVLQYPGVLDGIHKWAPSEPSKARNCFESDRSRV